MIPDELIRLMRTCTVAKVRAQLEQEHKKFQRAEKPSDTLYCKLVVFYQAVAARK